MKLNETTFESDLSTTMSTSTQHPPPEDNSDLIAMVFVVAALVALILVIVFVRALHKHGCIQPRALPNPGVWLYGAAQYIMNMQNKNERKEKEPLNKQDVDFGQWTI